MPAIATGFQHPLASGYTLTQSHNESSQFEYDTDSGLEYHLGEDWANGSFGGTVRAVANGEVVNASSYGSWGNLVVIEHTLPDGSIVTSIYGHLQTISVDVGDDVDIGDPIGTVGNGGLSTGPHLHFSIYLGDLGGAVPVGFVQYSDPDPYGSGYVDPADFLASHPGPTDQDPDLDARNGDPDFPATLSASSVVQGTDVTFSYRLSNWGPGASSSSTTGIYLSTNDTISTSDTLLTTDLVAALGAVTGLTENVTISTGNIAPGTYYIGAIADYDDDISETDEDNNSSNGVQITITASVSEPDLTISNVDVSPGSATPGGDVTVEFDVNNIGSGTAGASASYVYLSTNDTITASDTFLGFIECPFQKGVSDFSRL